MVEYPSHPHYLSDHQLIHTSSPLRTVHSMESQHAITDDELADLSKQPTVKLESFEDGVRLTIPPKLASDTWTIDDLRGTLLKVGNARAVRELALDQPLADFAYPPTAPGGNMEELSIRGLHVLKAYARAGLFDSLFPLLSFEGAIKELREVELTIRDYPDASTGRHDIDDKSCLDPFFDWYHDLVQARRDLQPGGQPPKVRVRYTYVHGRGSCSLRCKGTIEIVWTDDVTWKLSYERQSVDKRPVGNEQAVSPTTTEASQQLARPVAEYICAKPFQYVLAAASVADEEVEWIVCYALKGGRKPPLGTPKQAVWQWMIERLCEGKDLSPLTRPSEPEEQEEHMNWVTEETYEWEIGTD
ncbi:hypothetical protein PENSPDRAFT_735322 [Peniophora sp. CONT]|nr:hypothetical protein PENSPDRAFT_735322 [Peniophora sp. CONT]